jgi:pyruvate dehydrogenase E2 component (dihydrolipoamide acetyltransferase)
VIRPTSTSRFDYAMPSLGADMDEGRVVEWRVAVGDTVHRGDLIAVVETEKSDIDIEIWHDGVVEEFLVEVGQLSTSARRSSDCAPSTPQRRHHRPHHRCAIGRSSRRPGTGRPRRAQRCPRPRPRSSPSRHLRSGPARTGIAARATARRRTRCRSLDTRGQRTRVGAVIEADVIAASGTARCERRPTTPRSGNELLHRCGR